jgi:protein TonB
MQATVTENGAVEDLKVISGQPILAGAATRAVRQWKYRPFMLNGKPIRMKTQITVTFNAP